MPEIKEEYTFERGRFVLIDEELQLSHSESVKPLYLPEHPVKGQKEEGAILMKSDEECYFEKEGNRTGQNHLYYSSGSLKMETFYRDGLLHGPSTYFSEEGETLSKGWFIEGKREGKTHWYTLEGSLYSLQRFRNGVWEGKQEYYYPDGSLKTQLHYNRGKITGEAIL